MPFFTHSQFDNHEQVSFFSCPVTGLRAIVAIHNSNLGPALGGCRMWPYKNDEEALYDVLRLSKGMTYKAALADVPLGGGKSVIIGHSKTQQRADMMRSMAKCVQSFKGNYIVAEDVGTSVEDMNIMSESCDYVTGLFHDNKGSGDPSPTTAYGVFIGIKAAVKHRLHREELRGLKVSVQGLGHVGYHLCKLLHDQGVHLYVTDKDNHKIEQAVENFGAIAVDPDAIYDAETDVFAPCALGAVINDKTIQRLKVSIIAGAANNQLKEAYHGVLLSDANILYAPDYVINAGGLIRVYYEYATRDGTPFSENHVLKHTEKIAEKLALVFSYAEKHQIATASAADLLAEEVFNKQP
ncbi:MAG: leucine dehydrogenase [Chthoniobacterales bacterium]|nr:leucine dehydrogenase [Chthoniobacterales bacterium]